MKRIAVILLLATVALAAEARIPKSESGRIYTKPDPADSGGIVGTISKGTLIWAVAVDHDRKRVYLGDINGDSFRFDNVAVGKYDIVLITSDGKVYEGLALGEPVTALPPVSVENLKKRIAKADEFFNRSTPHRLGVDGDRAYAFVERLRDRTILKQSGEVLDAEIRRLEVIEFHQAGDDWQMVETRHLYREPEPGAGKHRPFLQPVNIPALGNIRVVNTVKQLGKIMVPLN